MPLLHTRDLVLTLTIELWYEMYKYVSVVLELMDTVQCGKMQTPGIIINASTESKCIIYNPYYWEVRWLANTLPRRKGKDKCIGLRPMHSSSILNPG